ncbi:hypothetical protein [Nonomuraea dietziae]|uniref:hypothetical protein n=1 Tax=Nonomuraea dietziae TaxID=65515 RepID=UPI0031D6DAD5
MFPGGPARLRVVGLSAKATGLGTRPPHDCWAPLETLEFVERDELSACPALGTAPITLGGVGLNQNPVHRADWARPPGGAGSWRPLCASA